MGEQRIQEVTMFALLFLLLGVLFLLAAAGRIWIDATPVDSRTIDATATDNGSDSATMKKISPGGDTLA